LAMKLHKSPVRALHYDLSGRFFLSGPIGNRIKIVNAKFDADVEESDSLFTGYNSNAMNRGLLGFATSKRTIAACGYSENIRVWHSSNPKTIIA
jgi:hypothetical protein